MQRWRILLPILLLGAVPSGCLPPSRPVAPSWSPSGGLLRVRSELRPPFRLERFSVVVDGEAMEATSAATSQRAPPRLTLTEGAHLLSVLAELTAPCGLGELPRQRVVLRVVREFTVGSTAVGVDVLLEDEGSPIASIEERPTLSVTLSGASPAPTEAADGATMPRSCVGLPPPHRRACAIAAEPVRFQRRVVRACAGHDPDFEAPAPPPPPQAPIPEGLLFCTRSATPEVAPTFATSLAGAPAGRAPTRSPRAAP